MYYCGWDGGGSTTKTLALDGQGNKIAEAVFGPLNPNGASLETVKQTITDAVQWMQSLPGGLSGCQGLAAGMAGVSNRQAAQTVEALSGCWATMRSPWPGRFRATARF